MHSTPQANPRPERGTFVPRPVNDRGWDGVSRKARCLPLAVRGFLSLLMSWSWRTGYCELSLKDLAVRGDIAYSTARIYLAMLCESDVPGFPGRKWVTVIGKGPRRLLYPVNKECEPMHPQEPSDENRHFEAEFHLSPAAAPLTLTHASDPERKIEPVNGASRIEEPEGPGLEADVDQGELEPVTDVDPEYAELEAMADAELKPIAADKRRSNTTRAMKASAILGNRRISDAKVNPVIRPNPPVPKPTPVRPAAAAPGPVTFGSLLRPLRPDSPREDIVKAALYAHEKLGDIGWEGKHINIILDVATGKLPKTGVKQAFEKALHDSKSANRPERPGAVYVKYIGKLLN
jgi:hypothetical protein